MSEQLSQFFLWSSLLACAAAAILHNNRQVLIAQLQAQMQRMAIVGTLKKLLIQTQQHRGMVNAYLNGDPSFQDKIHAQQLDINCQIGHIAGQLKRAPQHLPPFGNIESQWQNLQAASLHLTKDESFEKHISLIRAILNMMSEIAEHSQLRQDSGCPFSFIEIFWHLLPDAAEAIGQARGLGTGVAAAGRCQITERIKLGFLVTRIDQALKRVETGIAHLQANKALGKAYGAAHLRITELVTVIEQQLLAGNKPAIPPAHFFDLATNTLGSVFALYDHGEELTSQSLQNRFSEAQRKVKRSFALFFTTGVWVLVAFAQLTVSNNW